MGAWGAGTLLLKKGAGKEGRREGQVVDLPPHPTGKRWAGIQPSCLPSESGGGSRLLERDEGGVVVKVGLERDQGDLVQHCSRLLGKAKPGTPDAGLLEH